MNFFPRELCEKLEKIGCKSESDFFYRERRSVLGEWIWESIPQIGRPHNEYGVGPQYGSLIPAFYQNDFTGCHEQAWGNMKMIMESRGIKDLEWGEMARDVAYYRHQLIMQKDPAEYIEAKLLGDKKANVSSIS